MPTVLTWHNIAFRLILAAIASGLIGLNRDERGRPAGFRTNMLVCLAACIAMIQANILINSHGKMSDSFVVMDTMRLPLGILSGIGFIGAGAIVKRGELVVGLTTAATLWFVTVMGLCFGGGQIGLGIASFVIGFVILAALKRAESAIDREHKAILTVCVAEGGPEDSEIESLLRTSGLAIESRSMTYETVPDGSKKFRWNVKWKTKREDTSPPHVIQQLRKEPQILRLDFTM